VHAWLHELLDALETAGVLKAIETSSGLRFVQNVLGRFDLAPRFKFILASEDVVEGKPGPEIYQTAAARFGLPPRQVMVLEDSENGCRAAVAAGTFSVAVPSGHSRRHDFTGAQITAESCRFENLCRVAPVGVARCPRDIEYRSVPLFDGFRYNARDEWNSATDAAGRCSFFVVDL
jgi:beta-phosphoglucomutase-like phosphatase (HAD superfamily)